MHDAARRVKGPRRGGACLRAAVLGAVLVLAAACTERLVGARGPVPAEAQSHSTPPSSLPDATRDAAPPLPPVPPYPATLRERHVDVYHGVAVADPGHWLERTDTPAVQHWVQAENAVSVPFLAALPGRAAIKARLIATGNFERFGGSLQGGNSYVLPARHGAHYFYLHSGGLDDQSVLSVADNLEGPARVLLDPSALATDRTVSLADFEVSPDGAHVAYATSDAGSDWKAWRVRDVATGLDLPDTILFTKFTSVAWAADGQGFYYSRYPAREDGSGDGGKQVSVWFHALDSAQSGDRLVYATEDSTTRNPYATTSDDGRYVVLTVSDGFTSNAIYYLDLAVPGARAVRLLDRWDGRYSYLGNEGREFFFLSTAGAPRGTIVAVDLDRPEPAAWRTIVAESPDSIVDAHYVGGEIIVSALRDAHSLIRIYRPDGSARGEVTLPGLGQITGFDGRADEHETFYAYSDFLTPWTIYRFDTASNSSTLFRRPSVALDPAVYVTEQVFYASRDGTRVPMFITHRRDMPHDGRQPTLLYGYGGFDVPQLPAFSVAASAWLASGGVYAVANLRGGNEYGEAWHLAGTKTHKQNVFDDFIAAAEWLIANRVTSPRHLAIEGRSNGGLTVGATLVQRPDLFAVALPVVGVLDMLRYDTASANARQWSSDFGLAENAEEFAALRAYSPVHNVRRGVCYPPTLITTAAQDDRVVPWHSFKFAAALQRGQQRGAQCPNPVLLRVETRAGHGAGKPTWMQIEDFADEWSFAATYVGLRLGAP